jgi:hypothetical protein
LSKKKKFILLLLPALASASLISFLVYSCVQIWIPPYDPDVVKHDVSNYLSKKYGIKDVMFEEIERPKCSEAGPCDSLHVSVTPYDKDYPRVTFTVFYGIKDKFCNDDYLERVWDSQADDDLSRDVELAMGLSTRDQVSIEVFNKGTPFKDPKTFPSYRDELDHWVEDVGIYVTKNGNVNKMDAAPKHPLTPERWRQEAETLVSLKKKLLAKGITEDQLKLFRLNVEYGKNSYTISMDKVSYDVETTFWYLQTLDPQSYQDKTRLE